MSETITRLAPSPTGALHLGNIRTFVLNWLMARRDGWRILMRVEDLDGPRVKAGAGEAMLDDLRWLGLDWDGEITCQSDAAHTAAYTRALEKLAAAGQAYPCVCSRKEIELAAAAPHLDDPGAERPYPGTCCGRYASARAAREATGRDAAFRVRVGSGAIVVDDAFAGRHEFFLQRTCGDFVIFRSAGLAAYQLAVVVDDAASGVNAVVRGDDLLESAARQVHLRKLLGIEEEVRYWHLPLVLGPDGHRLAKRHGDTRLSHYRQAGASPQRVLGLVGWWSGMLDERGEASLPELLERWDLSRVPKAPAVFSADDNAYLTG